MKALRSSPINSSSPPLSPLKVIIKNEIHEPVSVLNSPIEAPFDLLEDCTASTSTTRIDSDSLLDIEPAPDTHPATKLPRKTRTEGQISTLNGGKSEQISSQYHCKICEIDVLTQDQCDIHVSAHENNLKCKICARTLKTVRSYGRHIGKCKPYKCNVCGKVIRFRPNLIKHKRIHCDRKQPTTLRSDDEDINVKEARKKYECDFCQKIFSSYEYFKVHRKTHSDNVDLKCPVCHKVFSGLACLKSHRKVHTGEKPFRCEICGKGFAQSYNLTIHHRSHSGEKPFQCKICKRCMSTTASYKAHMKTHKDYKCAICNEMFNQKIKYMSHMGIHETGKSLECTICGKKFGRSSNFYNHQRSHLGIKRFKCYICSQAFVKAATLDAHLLVHCERTGNSGLHLNN